MVQIIGGIINIITKNDTDSVKISSGSWSTNEGTLLKILIINGFNIQLSVTGKNLNQYQQKLHQIKGILIIQTT